MIGSKVCKKCEKSKAITEFYAHSMMADGFLNICKECTKERVLKHREKNIDRIREYDRERGKDKERIARTYECTRKWRNEDTRRNAAHSSVASAVRRGLLTKSPCSVCGAEKVVAHHESYSRPLDIAWLCQVHHKERHKEMAINNIDPSADTEDKQQNQG